MSIAELPQMTADELLSIPESDRYELVHGQLVEHVMSHQAVWIAARLITLLNVFLKQHDLGDVYSEGATYQCFPHEPGMVRKPDLSVIRKGRLSYSQFVRGHAKIAPDLAVEVLSPSDSACEVFEKLEDYFRAGIPLVWQINPSTRTVTVYADGGRQIVLLHEGDELTGGDVLPGFRCQVAEIFPPRADFLESTTVA